MNHKLESYNDKNNKLEIKDDLFNITILDKNLKGLKIIDIYYLEDQDGKTLYIELEKKKKIEILLPTKKDNYVWVDCK